VATQQIRLGDVGTVFVITITEDGDPVDISTATDMEIRFLKPSGETASLAAAHTTDGTDGKLEGTTTVDFIDETGFWSMQGFIELPSGAWHSEASDFRVTAAYGDA
jgi:hypothetical protein